MKKILVIHPNWVGDVIFSTAFLSALKRAEPDSYIASMVASRCVEVLHGNPDINEIITYDEKGVDRTLMAKFRFMSMLKEKNFNTAYILRRSLSRTVILLLSEIPNRIGYDNRKSGLLLSKRIPEPKHNIHRADYFLHLLAAQGINTSEACCEFAISDEDRAFARDLLAEYDIAGGAPFVVMNPGGNWGLKRWPIANFIVLGNLIADELEVPVVLSGALKDAALAHEINEGMNGRAIILAGKTTIKHVGAIFERASLMISNDSGPLHIATSCGVPAIALFGPTHPDITAPFRAKDVTIFREEVGCNDKPCYFLKCANNKCMKAVTPEKVFEKVKEIIKNK